MKTSIIRLHCIGFSLAVCLLIGLGTKAFATVEYQTVETLGTASTRDLAIDRALVNAVTQVNGAAIASRTRTSLSSRERIENNKATSVDKSSYSEAIAKKTKGVVKSFEIISEEREKETETFRVVLSVTVATFQRSPQLNRLRMAVVPFRINRAQKNHRAIRTFEENFRRSLENYLTQTRRFAILDRSFIAEQNEEFSFLLGRDGPIRKSTSGNSKPAQKQRFALVVGMGAYKKNTAFKTTVNSARLMARKLNALGFKVQLELDLTAPEFMSALVRFKKRLMAAPSDSTSLFFYSGHGASVNSTNIITSIDSSEFPLPRIFDEILVNYRGVKVVIIDACRSGNRISRNPLYKPPKPRDNTFISFSTAPGTVAQGRALGAEGLTVFSSSLTKFIDEPGLSIESIFKRVRDRTQKITNGTQIPWENSSLIREFYFHAGKRVNQGGKLERSASNKNFSGGTALEELARIGNRVGTDYLITGVVEKAYAYVKKTKMRTTGQVIKTPQIGARITYRVLDVATTQIGFAATAKLHRESGTLESTGDILAKTVGQKILNAIFPIYVLAVDGENVTLGQGGDTVKKGAVYSLVRLGKELIDPHTEEPLGRTEQTVGSIRVTDIQARMSTGQILKLTISKAALLKDDFIVRPRKGVSGAQMRAKKIKQTEKEIDAEFKKFDDDEEEDDKKW